MKIAYVSAYFYPVTGGAENHMHYIAKELVKRGHDVSVFVSDSDREGAVKEKQSVVDGIKVKRFKTWFKFSLSGMFFPGVFKAVKNFDGELVSVHGFRHPFSFANRFTRKNVASVVTPHWADYVGLRKRWLDILVRGFDKLFGGMFFRSYDRVLVVNGNEVNWIKSFNVPEENIRLTPNGIPKDYLKKRDGERFRKKFGIGNELMVLCLSRIHESKGFDQVIKTAKYFPNVKFVFVGVDGGYLGELKRLVGELDLKNILFTGSVSEEEKLEAYSAADIFIHPSHMEAFGIVVLEAFSQECAVLTSDAGGLPWVVGNCGLVFKDYELNDLRNKLEKLVEDKKLRNKFAKLGREKVKDFTWEKIVDKVEKIYEEVIYEKGRR